MRLRLSSRDATDSKILQNRYGTVAPFSTKQLSAFMTSLQELRQDLALSLLGEDWKKKHAGLAARDPHGDWVYHQAKAQTHKAAAKFHTAAIAVSGFHPKLSKKHNLGSPTRHLQLAKRHEALAAAHEKLKSTHKEPPLVPGTLSYAKRKSENP